MNNEVRFAVVDTKTGKVVSWCSNGAWADPLPSGLKVVDVGREPDHVTETWDDATQRITLFPGK